MKKNLATIAGGMLAIVGLAMAASGTGGQDPSFRLSTIERRVDQLQMRLEVLDRTVQNQSMTSRTDTSTEMMLELQRQNLSLGQQLLQLQQRMLEMQKGLDQLREQVGPAAKPKPVERKEEPRPKPPARP